MASHSQRPASTSTIPQRSQQPDSADPAASSPTTPSAALDDPVLIDHVRCAVELSADHVARGGIPFSALVVQGDRVLGTGVNQVLQDRDPTAHAEVVALRDAARRYGTLAVAGSTLIASGEPCALCYMAALYFQVDHVVFAADRYTAAEAGFDYVGSYQIFATDPTHWPLRVTSLPVEGARRPFDLWRQR